MKKILLTSLIILGLSAFVSCSKNNSSSLSSSINGNIQDSNSLEFNPFSSSSSSQESSISETTSSVEINPFSEIEGTYEGYDGAYYDIITLVIKNDGTLTMSWPSDFRDNPLNLTFTFKERNNDFYYYEDKENDHNLEVYKFNKNYRLSLTLDDGVYLEDNVWVDNTEFLAVK